MKYQNSSTSGEEYLLKNVLIKHFSDSNIPNPIIFDVGANTGEYSLLVHEIIPEAIIYSFEPNTETYKKLKYSAKSFDDILPYNLAFGSKVEKSKMYSNGLNIQSQHASLLRQVLVDFHHLEDIVELEIQISTIDKFCFEQRIEKIDFLKIDTEGYEIEVLKGAMGMIENNKIRCIQFEFNEMNIVSRVFLKDFYKILEKFTFYRLDSGRIIPLSEYKTINEIFRFQNILAINQNFE